MFNSGNGAGRHDRRSESKPPAEWRHVHGRGCPCFPAAQLHFGGCHELPTHHEVKDLLWRDKQETTNRRYFEMFYVCDLCVKPLESLVSLILTLHGKSINVLLKEWLAHTLILTHTGVERGLQDEINATNTSHSSDEHQTRGSENVSPESRIIYFPGYGVAFILSSWSFYWCQLVFWLQSREASAHIFPRDLGVALPQRQVFKSLQKYLACVGVTCFRLNVSGAPDCLYLREIYSQFKGFSAAERWRGEREAQKTGMGWGGTQRVRIRKGCWKGKMGLRGEGRCESSL